MNRLRWSGKCWNNLEYARNGRLGGIIKKMGWIRLEYARIGWNRIKYDGIGWNGLEYAGIRLNGLYWAGIGLKMLE